MFMIFFGKVEGEVKSQQSEENENRIYSIAKNTLTTLKVTSAESASNPKRKKYAISATNGEVVLSVPFTVQAPNASWNIHEESCEEAAILMYHYFLKGKTDISVIPSQTANDEIISMKNWQKTNYGSEPDLSIKNLGKFANEYYGYKYEVFENITKEDIMSQIQSGRPVIVPVITHALGNPNYGANPAYHMLLIKGYKNTGVITNDAGVSQGRNWFYTWNTLFSAIDAQTPKMGQGRTMIIIKS